MQLMIITINAEFAGELGRFMAGRAKRDNAQLSTYPISQLRICGQP